MQEYCNHPGGTALSDMRRAHGHADPFDVRMWCLGNEMDGPWQMGHKTAAEYGRIAAEVARGMRRIDPDLELVACSSSHSAMPTFGAWGAEVLEQAYEHVDFISAHAYYQERDGDLASFLASADNMEAFIDDVVATADHVRAKVRASKRINVSFDEWNVWYQSDLAPQLPPDDEWPVAPRLGEDVHTAADAVAVGSLLITLLRHSDRVTAACQAQLVNTIAPIHAEPGGPAHRKASFYPFAHASRFAAGDVLRVEVRGPSFSNETYGESAAVHAVATHDPDSGEVVVFAVNRHPDEAVGLSIGVRAFPRHRVVEHLVLHDDDPHAANTTQGAERVTPRRVEGARTEDGEVRVDLAPVSWNVLRLQPDA